MKLQTNVMILLATPSLFAGYLTIVIIDVIQDAPIIRTSYIKSAIRPPSFVIKSRYNFTIAGCLEEYFNCKSDVTQPDRKYEPTQLYYGIYQSSQQVLFYGNDYNQLDSITISFSYTIDNNWGMVSC
ncbi:8118_t:CDS:2 [Rhizophagus irregularis]|nr:8118_t:CDS:2 [Rhizophagus irregularis]